MKPFHGRETVEAKGHRYLAEGRLTVTTVAGDHVRAICRGAEDVYTLGHDEHARWWCTCPAPRRCSHLVALELVTVNKPDGLTL